MVSPDSTNSIASSSTIGDTARRADPGSADHGGHGEAVTRCSASTVGGAGERPAPTVKTQNSPETQRKHSGVGGILDDRGSLPRQATSLCTNVAIPQDISLPIPQAAVGANVIMGLPALREFLQPRGSWFKDKQANVVSFRGFKHANDDTVFLMAETKGKDKYASRENPYRKYRLARSHSGRTVGELRGVIVNNGLKDFRLADVVVTMPAEVSKALSEKGNGQDIAWRMFKRWCRQLPGILGLPDGAGELAAGSNLHTWASDEPLKPHYHIHTLLPNYVVRYGDSSTFTKWFGGGVVKRYWDDGLDKTRTKQVRRPGWRSGCVPFSAEQLSEVKRVWTKAVRDVCRRYGIGVLYFRDKAALCDVFVGFSKWDDTKESRAKFIHKVNYQKRSWVEDYASYSNVHTDCSDPPSWLEGYSNRTRAFGWWMRLSELAGDEAVGSKAKVSPLTGEAMVKLGPFGVLDVCESKVVGFDVVKGRSKWWVLDDRDKRWLWNVCDLGSPGGTRGYGEHPYAQLDDGHSFRRGW